MSETREKTEDSNRRTVPIAGIAAGVATALILLHVNAGISRYIRKRKIEKFRQHLDDRNSQPE